MSHPSSSRWSRRLAGLLPGLLLTALACGERPLPTSAERLAGTSPRATLAQVASAPVVNSLADPGTGTCDDVECTLREAIAFADPGATITFGVTGTIGLTAGQLSIAKNLTIDGPGASALVVSRSSGYSRILYVGAGVVANVAGITITNGRVFFGAGVYNDGTLTLSRVAVTHNVSTDDFTGESSGGIHNVGVLSLDGSLVAWNRANAAGAMGNTGSVTITNSTITGNNAFSVGGIINTGGTLAISHSTIAGNTSSVNGGAISGPATVTNSIIAGNTPYNCSHGPNTDGGYNIDDGVTCGFSGAGTTSLQSTNPLLAAAGLADNGGPTRTYALQATSPALNAIPNGANGCGTAGLTDQRGITRPQGTACEIGAFELEQDGTAPTITITAPVDGGTYLLGATVLADYACQDETGGSGLASCTGTVADGAAIGTATPGAKTFVVQAADVAGNTRSASAPYTVTYGFSGFAAPVENGATLNVAKAGRAIPLKWRLVDASGTPVTTLGGVTVSVASLSCALGSTSDAVEEYAAGASGLQNLGDGYYQYNWATPKSYAGSCKTLHLDLGEGITREARFQFTK